MPFLAHYTIRSKQAYIFRTNRMKEISGASKLIEEAWELLFSAAEDAGLSVKRLDGNDDFPHDPSKAFSGGFNMVDLFRGGGNDTVLFDSRDSFVIANRAFTGRLLRECPGMTSLAVGVETSLNYKEDYERLMEALDKEKNRMQMSVSRAMMPFSQMDRSTFMPITNIYKGDQLSAEAYAKRKRYDREPKERSAAALDQEPLLAVIHADGNNMGVKIRDLLGSKTDYNDCVPLMRRFTRETAEKVFSREGIEFPEEANMRWVINSGDDATVVCEAKYAEQIAEAYLTAISKRPKETSLDIKFIYSACAGICIFHNGFPFSSAYSIAEDACSSAKRSMRSAEGTDGAWIDFHFIHNGVGGNLDDIREEENTKDRMARPIRIDSEGNALTAGKMRKLRSLFEEYGVTRTNIKTLGIEWEKNKGDGKRELSRVEFRAPGLKKELINLFGKEDAAMKAIYDLSEVFDIEWF